MNFCHKCEKQVPTNVIDENEECMVCGSIIDKSSISKNKNIVNSSMMKNFKEVTKVDEDTGKYKNAQKLGRNVLIGFIVIIAGILYSIGGFGAIFKVTVALIGFLVLLSVILYIVAAVT
jgi:hypothetical protein